MIPRPAVFSPNLYHLVSSILKRASAKILRQMSSHLEPRARIITRNIFPKLGNKSRLPPSSRFFAPLLMRVSWREKSGKNSAETFLLEFKKKPSGRWMETITLTLHFSPFVSFEPLEEQNSAHKPT